MTRRLFLALAASLTFVAPAAAQLAIGARSKPQTSYYLGQVATVTTVPGSLDTTNTYAMTRSPHIARDNIASLTAVFSNFRVNTGFGAETGPGNAQSITASVEYPSGTCTQIKFSGSASGSIPNVGMLTSDAVTVSIPAGARFWIRQWSYSSGGTVYDSDSVQQDGGNGEIDLFGTSLTAVPDSTWSSGNACPAFTGNSSYARKPLALLGQTQRPSVCLVGDSRMHGANDSVSGTRVDHGEIAPSIGPYMAYLNLGADGDRSGAPVTSGHWTNRGQLLAYCTHAVWGYGINDFRSSVSVATVLSNFASLRASWPNIVWFAETISPYDASSDGFETATNQTPDSTSNSLRAAYNDQLRAGISGVTTIDTAAVTEQSPLDSGYWRYNGTYEFMTYDGLHVDTSGANYLLASGFLNALKLFTR